MNSIVGQLISQPDATVIYAQQSVNRAIGTELGERAAVLQSGLNPCVTQSNRQQVIDWLYHVSLNAPKIKQLRSLPDYGQKN